VIEDLIEAHVQDRARDAYPELAVPRSLTADGADEQILVRCTSGEMVYDRFKGRRCIGTEVLTVEVTVFSAAPIDRRPFIRQFGRKEIDLGDGFKVFQELKRHEYHDHIASSGMKAVVFTLAYTYDILED